jgi:hypothetical protein
MWPARLGQHTSRLGQFCRLLCAMIPDAPRQWIAAPLR